MKSRFTKVNTPLDGLYRIERKPIVDPRGFLCRIHCESEFSQMGLDPHPSQINHTLTNGKGTVRGLHFQFPPHCESKLVSCLEGEIWDVVVDLRRNSPTFMKWHAEELSQDNARMIIIPEGCAHGFQALEAESELLYLHTEYYTPDAEDGLAYDEPLLNISWPLPVTEISERDKCHPKLDQNFSGIKL